MTIQVVSTHIYLLEVMWKVFIFPEMSNLGKAKDYVLLNHKGSARKFSTPKDTHIKCSCLHLPSRGLKAGPVASHGDSMIFIQRTLLKTYGSNQMNMVTRERKSNHGQGGFEEGDEYRGLVFCFLWALSSARSAVSLSNRLLEMLGMRR